MSDIEVLKKKRSVLRSLTTKLINNTQANLNDIRDNTELETIFDHLVEKSIELKSIDKEIEKHLSVDDIESEIIQCDEYNSKIILWKRKVKCKLDESKKSSEIASNVVNTSGLLINDQSNISSNVNSQRSDCNIVKLPKLSLNKFFGDSSMWIEFWQQFESAIHNNGNLSKIDKFNYLKTFLGGTALKTVSGFSLTNENYDSAVKLLEDRFGRKDIIINSLMNKLLTLDPLRNSSNVREFRKFYDELEIQIRSLDSLGVTAGSYGHLLYPILLKLIPSDIALEFNRQRKNCVEIDINELVKFLKSELQFRENSILLQEPKKDKKFYSANISKSGYKSNNVRNVNYNQNNQTTSAFTASVSKPFCIFCDNSSSHDSFHCDSTSIEDKFDKLKLEKRCFKCLKRFHRSTQCRKRINPCKKCNSTNHYEISCNVQNVENKIEKPQIENKTVVSISHCDKFNSGSKYIIANLFSIGLLRFKI